MPIYEYRCQKCGGVTELLIRSEQDEDAIQCRHCNSPSLQRLLSLPAVGPQSSRQPHQAECDKNSPCCGRETRCDQPPCET